MLTQILTLFALLNPLLISSYSELEIGRIESCPALTDNIGYTTRRRDEYTAHNKQQLLLPQKSRDLAGWTPLPAGY